jgi:hypothetical protein
MHSCNLNCDPQCLYTFHTNSHNRHRFVPDLLGLAGLGCTLLGLIGLSREQGLGSKLLLGLIVAVGDQPVEEAVGTAGVMALSLCALDLAVEVACGLLIDVVLAVVLVEVGWELSVYHLDTRRHASRLGQCAHTVLVVHGQLALQLLSDAGHLSLWFVGLVLML